MRNSSTSRSRLRAWLLAGLTTCVLLPAAPAHALDPERAMSQYIRETWGAAQGFPGGEVYAIAQTPDGYLWIGAEKGLVRFDGLRFKLMTLPSPAASSIVRVLGLTTDREGTLWVRLQGASVLRYRGGRFEDTLTGLPQEEVGVTAMTRGRDGSVLVAGLLNGAIRSGGTHPQRLVTSGVMPNSVVISMAESADGVLWIGTRDAGLFSLRDGLVSPVTPLLKDLPDRKINCVLPFDDRELWLGTDNGIVRWNGTTMSTVGAAGAGAGATALGRVQALSMIRDRESNVWVGTASGGLLRINARGVTTLGEREARALGTVAALFEDREGNVWAGGAQGLTRVRDSAFVTFSGADVPPSDSHGPIYVDATGRTWFAPAEGGLYWRKGGQVGRVTAAGLGGDVVYSLSGDRARGEVWVGRQRGGLTRLRPQEEPDGPEGGSGGGLEADAFAAETFTQRDGLAQDSVYAVHQSRDGTVWAGTLSGGLSRLKDGRFTTYTVAHGLPSNTITAIAEGASGTMWFGTANGLSALLANGRWQVYATAEGLPSPSITCLFEDAGGVIWIGTNEGLAVLDRESGRVQVPRDPPEALGEPILGLAADGAGGLWIASANHVLRVKRDALLRGGPNGADVREFGLADGLQSIEAVKRHRAVVSDARGRIWFSMNRGLSVVDPARATGGAAPALVHIESLAADGKPIGLGDPTALVQVPSGRQRITFAFTGLSLSVPERVRFRYRLDNFDHHWSQPATSREAVYTNLGPGSYHFRVMASNSDGVWNGSEAGVGFEIEPVFWQTWWFRLTAVLIAGCAGLALYRVRLHQVSRRLSVRFEERLAERTRIAQELHDTLLQGFISASMQLHVTAAQLPDGSPAQSSLRRVLKLMGQVIDEGRNAVRGLRASTADINDLGQAFSRIQQEIGTPATQDGVGFRVIVEGRPRPLHPIIRDEVYRIGREALVNAFRHSGAQQIEVELDYAASHLRVLVRDDGCGIDVQVLRSGREGHWGLSGMRERAERIGARLKLRSREHAGTEVELSLPSHVAFAPAAAASASGSASASASPGSPAAASAAPAPVSSSWWTRWWPHGHTRRSVGAPSDIEHDS